MSILQSCKTSPPLICLFFGCCCFCLFVCLFFYTNLLEKYIVKSKRLLLKVDILDYHWHIDQQQYFIKHPWLFSYPVLKEFWRYLVWFQLLVLNENFTLQLFRTRKARVFNKIRFKHELCYQSLSKDFLSKQRAKWKIYSPGVTKGASKKERERREEKKRKKEGDKKGTDR